MKTKKNIIIICFCVIAMTACAKRQSAAQTSIIDDITYPPSIASIDAIIKGLEAEVKAQNIKEAAEKK